MDVIGEDTTWGLGRWIGKYLSISSRGCMCEVGSQPIQQHSKRKRFPPARHRERQTTDRQHGPNRHLCRHDLPR
jgi:hypothetical protein